MTAQLTSQVTTAQECDVTLILGGLHWPGGPAAVLISTDSENGPNWEKKDIDFEFQSNGYTGLCHEEGISYFCGRKSLILCLSVINLLTAELDS